MDFSGRLAALIEKTGLSQKEFAKKSGLTEAAISRYLHGNRLPNMGALLILKQSLDCSWEELMEG